LLERINELVVKKQQDLDRDPQNRLWKKDKLLSNSVQALAY